MPDSKAVVIACCVKGTYLSTYPVDYLGRSHFTGSY